MFTRMALLLSPEWRALSQERRALAWRDCVNPLVRLWSWMIARSTFITLALLAVLSVTAWPVSAIIFVATILVAADLLDILWVFLRWQTVRDFIQQQGSGAPSAV